LTRHLPLDFFVMFSSISSVFGSPGQANHSAANAFLDALAYHRRTQSLPALSINWGAWRDVGAAARRGADRRVGGQGIEPFSPAQGLAALERLLASPYAQVAVVPVSWPKFLAQLPQARRWPFFAAFASERAASVKTANRTQPTAVSAALPSDLLQRLEAAAPARREHVLLSHVQGLVVRVLALDASRPLDRKQPLSEMGMDSLMAVELRNLLGSSVARTLPATLLFDYPTVAAVAEYLAHQVLTAPPAVATTATNPIASDPDIPAGDVLDQMENLSDDEIDRIFERAKGVVVK
jgi:acyl carrier protein